MGNRALEPPSNDDVNSSGLASSEDEEQLSVRSPVQTFECILDESDYKNDCSTDESSAASSSPSRSPPRLPPPSLQSPSLQSVKKGLRSILRPSSHPTPPTNICEEDGSDILSYCPEEIEVAMDGPLEPDNYETDDESSRYSRISRGKRKKRRCMLGLCMAIILIIVLIAVASGTSSNRGRGSGSTAASAATGVEQGQGPPGESSSIESSSGGASSGESSSGESPSGESPSGESSSGESSSGESPSGGASSGGASSEESSSGESLSGGASSGQGPTGQAPPRPGPPGQVPQRPGPAVDQQSESDDEPTPAPTECENEVGAVASCYEYGDDVSIYFRNCDPKADDWIGIYPYDDTQDPSSLPSPLDWLWTCGTQNCRGKVLMDELPFGNEFEIGVYDIYLIERKKGGPYPSKVKSSTPLIITDRCP